MNYFTKLFFLILSGVLVATHAIGMQQSTSFAQEGPSLLLTGSALGLIIACAYLHDKSYPKKFYHRLKPSALIEEEEEYAKERFRNEFQIYYVINRQSYLMPNAFVAFTNHEDVIRSAMEKPYLRAEKIAENSKNRWGNELYKFTLINYSQQNIDNFSELFPNDVVGPIFFHSSPAKARAG